MDKRRVRLGLFYLILAPLIVLVALAGIGIGSTQVSWSTIVQVVGQKVLPAGWVNTSGLTEADTVIVWLIRVPRVIVAAFVGAALSVGGAVMQGLFRNPLAESGLVGAGSEAALGAVIIRRRLDGLVNSLVAAGRYHRRASRLGACLRDGDSRWRHSSRDAPPFRCRRDISSNRRWSLLLSINIVNWQIAQEIVFWIMGGLDARSWTHVWLCGPFVLLGLAAALFQASITVS